MTVILSEIIDIMEEIAPPEFAEEWDNVGLQIGNPNWQVKSVWVALDPLPEVVHAACEADIDMLITHHPLIFQPLRTINIQTAIGSIIDEAVRHRLAIFAAHTNFDSAAQGLNDILAEKIGISDSTPLQTDAIGPGIGRIGRLAHACSLEKLVLNLKTKLGLNHIKFTGKPDLNVQQVAICTGSGSGLLQNFLSSGAQAYISGDLRYHDARQAEAINVGLIDIGHFPSEHLMVEALSDRLQAIFTRRELKVRVEPCRIEKDPYTVL